MSLRDPAAQNPTASRRGPVLRPNSIAFRDASPHGRTAVLPPVKILDDKNRIRVEKKKVGQLSKTDSDIGSP